MPLGRRGRRAGTLVLSPARLPKKEVAGHVARVAPRHPAGHRGWPAPGSAGAGLTYAGRVPTAVRLVLGCALLLAAAALFAVAVLGARGRLSRNPWAGVRTRATLASDEAFTLANRVAAAPLGAAGAVALLGGAALLVGGPSAVTWTVLVIATAGMLGLTGLGGAWGDRAASRVPAPRAACAGTCAGCDLVAGCRPAATSPAETRDRS